MTELATVYLMIGVRFGGFLQEDQQDALMELLSEEIGEVQESDLFIIGSAYGFDSVVLKWLAFQPVKPKVRVIAPFRTATDTWPREAAREFSETIEALNADLTWVAQQHDVGVYTRRDIEATNAARKASEQSGAELQAIVLWPGHPGVLADAILGAVNAGAWLHNIYPAFRHYIQQ